MPDNDVPTDGPDALRALRRRWQEQYQAGGEREADFTTLSGEEVAPLYDPLDHPDRDVAAQIGVPGLYPFTRGVYPSMYRGRPWTIRQFSGFGNARETNERYMLMSPFPGLPSPIVISSWAHQLRLDSPDDPRLQRYVDVFRMNPKYSPEYGPTCEGQPEPIGGRPAFD